MNLSAFARIVLGASTALILSAAAPSWSAEEMRLAVFGDRENPRGRWSLEVLESSDPEVRTYAAQAAKMSVCMDAAQEMTKSREDSDRCSQQLLKNTSAEAELEMRCPDGELMRMSIRRESKDSFVFESRTTRKGAAAETMKGRYRYAGPCDSDDGVVGFDKDSEVCRQMRATMAEMNPDSACAGLPADQRSACIERIRSSLESTAKMCQ
jgi:hypothetical protein